MQLDFWRVDLRFFFFPLSMVVLTIENYKMLNLYFYLVDLTFGEYYMKVVARIQLQMKFCSIMNKLDV